MVIIHYQRWIRVRIRSTEVSPIFPHMNNFLAPPPDGVKWKKKKQKTKYERKHMKEALKYITRIQFSGTF
jgi:hypothetical protein